MAVEYYVVDPAAAPTAIPESAVQLVEGQTLATGIKAFNKKLGAASSLEADVLRMAAAVFAADRGTERGSREDVARTISVSIPVVNAATLVPFKAPIEDILGFLSRDRWTLTFRQMLGTPESIQSWPENAGSTLLFSGGLDSLAGAIEFGDDVQTPLQLVSHVTHNTSTSSTQTSLASALTNSLQGISAHQQFFVSSKGSAQFKHDVENSQRTRSFVFLVLAALAARRTGQRTIVMLAENGQMAIHLALTSARIGAFSTLTAHPTFLANMRGVLEGLLGCSFVLQNPYVHRTKREVVSIIAKRAPDLLPIANSCWRNARLTSGTHCGACVPCYVRRIALESLRDEPTAYARDVWREDVGSLDEADDGKRNLVDLLEFIERIDSLPDSEIMNEWPELYSADLDAPNVIAMYKRFAGEAKDVFARYPSVAALL